MEDKTLQTVVEMPEYIKQAESCMDKQSRSSFIDYIALNPLAEELIQGTGGARKIRWTSNAHQGKRGGSRIIYYYHDQDMPIFLFTAYSKNQRENLTKKVECNILQKVIKQISETYER